LFLSGIITALPILTLINMGMQMKNMKEDTFHSVLQNTVFGAVGMLLFTVLAFLLTYWFNFFQQKSPTSIGGEMNADLCYFSAGVQTSAEIS